MSRSRKQAAVIAYRAHREHPVEIALVRKSSGKGWTVPKGCIDRGERGWDAAVREAEEEAGIVGELTPRPIGRYSYSKQDESYDVHVYVMRVTIVLESWREAAHRGRRWMTVEEAMERLNPELHDFVREAMRIAQSVAQHRRRANERPRHLIASRNPTHAMKSPPIGTEPPHRVGRALRM